MILGSSGSTLGSANSQLGSAAFSATVYPALIRFTNESVVPPNMSDVSFGVDTMTGGTISSANVGNEDLES